MNPKRYFSLLLSLTIIAVSLQSLNGCGWRLRGGLTLPDGLELVHVTSANASGSANRFDRYLIQLLEANGVTTVDNPQDAQITIATGALEETRRVVSTGGNTLVTEYELESRIAFSVQNNQGELLIPNETAIATRVYEFDQNDIVGKAEEERIIQTEMQRDLVQQIVRRLRFIGDSVAPSNPEGTTNL